MVSVFELSLPFATYPGILTQSPASVGRWSSLHTTVAHRIVGMLTA